MKQINLRVKRGIIDTESCIAPSYHCGAVRHTLDPLQADKRSSPDSLSEGISSCHLHKALLSIRSPAGAELRRGITAPPQSQPCLYTCSRQIPVLVTGEQAHTGEDLQQYGFNKHNEKPFEFILPQHRHPLVSTPVGEFARGVIHYVLTGRSVPANTSCRLEDAGLLMPFVTGEPALGSQRAAPRPRLSTDLYPTL
ncbi:unnamed protein product [Pleuronectes platessa]|uniref:Uncharacterized protein n=1 Tax=Pleuronectes platessa TaxID=8262 RepID=A0A9N7V2X1_PLEPL|nr:unnamed protein product [Pleuronectes platessa]